MKKNNIEAIETPSPTQQGILFETLGAPERGLHIEQRIITLMGKLDHAVFERAWLWVIRRHPILRTGFVWKGQKDVLQVTLDHVDIPISWHDWCEHSTSAQEELLEKWGREDRQRGFKLSHAPLMRLILLRVNSTIYHIVWTYHTLILDYQSCEMILQELLSYYETLYAGEAIEVASALSYRDYLTWLKTQNVEQPKQFWLSSLQGFRHPTSLGVEKPPLVLNPSEDARAKQTCQLTGMLSEQLYAIAAQHRIALKTILQGAWALLLGRYSGTQDVVFGITVSARPTELLGSETIVGQCSNTLPLRVRQQLDLPVWQWLGQLQAHTLDLQQFAYSHSGLVHQWSDVPGHQLLFESCVLLEPVSPSSSDAYPGSIHIQITSSSVREADTKYALLFLINGGPTVTISCIYDTCRFSHVTIGHMLQHMQAILTHLATSKDEPLSVLSAHLSAVEIPSELVDIPALTSQAYRPPQNEMEETVATIWSDILGLPEVSVDANFFHQGGHSLLASELISRLRAVTDVEIPVRCLWEYPTIAALAAWIEQTKQDKQAGGIPPLLPVPRNRAAPLSFAQQRLWFLDQWEQGNTTYSIPSAVRLYGALDVKALKRGLNELLVRHESLRTVFQMEEEQPVQIVKAIGASYFPLIDLQALSLANRTSITLELVQAEADYAFDLACGPLIRLALLRCDKQDHVLLVTMHHIISDRWSMGIFVHELTVLYNAFVAGQPASLPPLVIQYSDFAVWQRQWLQNEVRATQLRYWVSQLQGLEPLQLPTDYPRPAAQTFRGAHQQYLLPAALRDKLRSVSREERATLFMLLVAAFQLLLSHYSGQSDIVIGTDIANRPRTETEGLIGLFMNTLVLRTKLAGNPRFRQLLRQVRTVCLDAYAHQDFPFEKLVEVLLPERDLSRSPLFQVMVSLQSLTRMVDGLQGLQAETIEFNGTHAKFDLNLTISDAEEGLFCEMEYNIDLFAQHTISQLLAHFHVLLEGVAAHPDWTIAQLPLLNEYEYAHILHEWNTTQSDGFSELHLASLFEMQVVNGPDRVAVVYQDHALTYAEIDRRANLFALYLRNIGIGTDTLVGIYMERSVEMLVGMLAIFKVGGAYVPLDPAYPRERLHLILADAHVPVVLTMNALQANVSEGLWTVICYDLCWSLLVEELLSGSCVYHPEQLAYVIYTSGSTGRPKGAMVTQRGMLNHLYAKIKDLEITAGDRLAQTASACFDISVWQFWAALVQGGQVEILTDDDAHDPRRLYRYLQRSAVTLLEIVPSLLHLLLNDEDHTALDDLSLRCLVATGEAITPALAQQWLQCSAHSFLINAYGPTECSDDVTHSWVRLESMHECSTVSIGRPIANTRLYILDRYFAPIPVGIPGEIYVGGVGVGRGYLNEPGRTADVFVPDPFGEQEGGRLYRTGDLGRYLADGQIEFLGRMDYQVKVRGFRIEPGEVEVVIMRHAEISQCVARVWESEDGQSLLIAYIVLCEQAEMRVEELRSSLLEQLPEYMVPSLIIKLDALPLTANGKIDRQALPTPNVDSLRAGPLLTPGRTPVEELIVGIYADILKRRQVNPQDNFFDLGGHSLLATQIVARLRATFQVEVPLRDMFKQPTARGLAQLVEQARWKEGMPGGLPPLLPIPRVTLLPLSFAQQRLWFLHQLEPESTAYTVPNAVSLEGPLDRNALHKSVQEIINRHESLRTTFRLYEGEPYQVIEEASLLQIPVLDVSTLHDQTGEKEARRVALCEAERPFHLEHGPLLRVLLIQVRAQEHILLVTMHHIISDGWSMEVFVRELSLLYNAFIAGQPSPLPALPIQYVDYAYWQRQWLQGEVLETQLHYWTGQLRALPPLNMPTDRPRPPVQTFQGNQQVLHLPGALHAQLAMLSRQEGSTLFMLLLTAFQILLARYSRQDDFAVGTPIANRLQVETEGLIGFFVNTLVLRTDLSGNPSLRTLLRRVREVCLDAYAHQDIPFEKLVETLQPERDLSRSPLFQVMFILQNVPQSTEELGDLTVENWLQEGTTAKFDLTLIVTEGDSGLTCAIEYNTDLYEQDTIIQLLHHWHMLLERIVAAPDQRIANLSLLSDADLAQLLFWWNGPQREYPVNESLQHLIERQGMLIGDSIALQFEDMQLTYAELNTRTNELAAYLSGLGVGPDSLVGICMERSLELVVGLIGILKAGGAYVPLDPAYPGERLAFMLADSQIGVLLTTRNLLWTLPEISLAQCICLDGSAYTEHRERSYLSHKPAFVHHPDLAAYMIYTSGSTGRPKGAVNSHRAICNRLHWMQEHIYPLQGCDRVLQKTPFSFDVSVWEFFWPLVNGAVLVLAEPGRHGESGYLLRLIAEQSITVMHFVPSMLQSFLREPHLELCAPLQLVVCSGEALSLDLQERFLAQMDARLLNLYGPTEAAVEVTAWECVRGSKRLTVPIGYPIANVRTYVLDEYLQPVPAGVAGELYIGGVCLARGYWRCPDLTADRFIPDPFSPLAGARLYRTGDQVCYRADGSVEYLGRLDYQMKIRGFRIELGEIEATLVSHPQVREAIVSAWDDATLGKRLVAYTVAEPGYEQQTNIARDLQSYLQERLPDYMVPTLYVQLDVFPLTTSGKILRSALPVPDMNSIETGHGQDHARTPIEEMLVSIWRDVLDREQIGIRDNFFFLGGHSLLATNVISRLRAILEIELPLRYIFEYPTIVSLAAQVEQEQRSRSGLEALPPLEPVARTQGLPLSFAQQRLWFLDQLEPESTAYSLPNAVWLHGQLDVDALIESLHEVVQRHESLRTTFQVYADQPLQVIHEYMEWSLPLIDIRHHESALRENIARELVKQEFQRPFNLVHGPLFRGLLLCLDEYEHVLVLNMHHIVADGWSMGVLISEISVLYTAFSSQRPSPLPALPIQYADYAVWQRQWLQGNVLDTQVHYWKKQLEGVAPLALPTDRSRLAVQTAHGASESLVFPAHVREGLKVLSQREGVTFFMLLLATFQVLLYRYTGQARIAVGTNIANRRHETLEGLIGFFVNTLVLHTDLSGNPSFLQLLARVKEVALGAYAHQDVPFEKLVEVLQPERDLSRLPLFQVMFLLQQEVQSVSDKTLRGMALDNFAVGEVTAKFDLTISLAEIEQGIDCAIIYNTDLFNASTIVQLLKHWQILLEGIIARPETAIAALPLLNAAELQMQLFDWNSSWADYPEHTCIHTLFEAQVERIPDTIAVVDGDESYTYAMLNRKANQLANHLIDYGIGPDVLVGLYLERSWEAIVGVLGIIKAGGAYVPLDVLYPQDRLAFLLKDARLSMLLTLDRFASSLPETYDGQVLCLDDDWLVQHIAQQDDQNPRTAVCEQNGIYVIYTSGSTGQPKGTLVEHRSLVSYMVWVKQQLFYESDWGVPFVTELTFDASLKQLFAPLVYGFAVWVMPRHIVTQPDALLQVLHSQGHRYFNCVPSLWSTIMDYLALERNTTALEQITTLFVGGERLSSELVRRTHALLPYLHIYNLYGPTEATINATYAPDVVVDAVPIGRPIFNTQIYLLNPYGFPVPVGVTGEIYIGGVGVTRGYIERPELTAERFTPDPFSRSPGARLYCTGDLGRYTDDGQIEFVGRVDHQVKLRGFRIELGEIETVLAQYPGVREDIVVVRDDQPGDERLIAYVVLDDDASASVEGIRGYLQQKLPAYMQPTAFVVLPSLPLNHNGKVDRKALPTPERVRPELKVALVAPRSPAEEVMAAIWLDVLKIERVGVHDNFFEVGGHSLLATQIVSRIRQIFQVELPLRSLFEEPTIDGLVRTIAHLQGGRDIVEEIAQMFREIEQLSEDEVQQQLSH